MKTKIIATISLERSNILRLSAFKGCNLSCVFCFWGDNPPLEKIPFTKDEYAFILSTAIKSGYFPRHMLTGGEPLLLPDQLLQRIVSEVYSHKGKGMIYFTICTNGINLADKAAMLADSGMDNINVSLAETSELGYKAYTRSNYDISLVLQGISEAAARGIKVKVDTAVLKKGNYGIYSYPRMLELYQLVKNAGATSLSLFPVTKTPFNTGTVGNIIVPVSKITSELVRDSRFIMTHSDGVDRFTDNSGFVVSFPYRKAVTQIKCTTDGCAEHCQGDQGSYIEASVFRFCHRIFPQHSNEVDIAEIVHRQDSAALTRLFRFSEEWKGHE